MCCENVYIVQSHGSFLVKVLWTPPPSPGVPSIQNFQIFDSKGGRVTDPYLGKSAYNLFNNTYLTIHDLDYACT